MLLKCKLDDIPYVMMLNIMVAVNSNRSIHKHTNFKSYIYFLFLHYGLGLNTHVIEILARQMKNHLS